MAAIENTYDVIIGRLKEKIRLARQKASIAVNHELLQVYWEIGHTILQQQKEEGWGKKVISRLSKDLKAEFPEMRSLSERNLVYMQTFAGTWPHYPFTQPPVAELKNKPAKRQAVITQSPVAKLKDAGMNAQPLLSQIPWTHHTVILDKTTTKEERIFYITKTAENGWSKAVLAIQIANQLYLRQGRAITNFAVTLPKHQSDLAKETLKNPYIFDILGITDEIQERELEKVFIQHIKKFMLELGRGFAYVGNQYNLVVESDDYFLDLLFYNYHLHCFVVFELKVGDFKPEYTGKLNFYINTVDEKIKGTGDAATIGVLLCKTPNTTVVKYSLKGIDTPMGVAEYKFTNALPKQLKGEMPTIKELEAQLETTSALLLKPIDEKKNKLKNILGKIKGDEVKTEKDRESLLYIFDEVLWVIKEYAEQLLKEEMVMFQKASINRTINDSPFNATSVDLEANLLKNGVYSIGLEIILETFKKGGTKAFNVYKKLSLELSKHKYRIVEKGGSHWGEYLYHHKWSKDELQQITERWSELIIDDISAAAEKL